MCGYGAEARSDADSYLTCISAMPENQIFKGTHRRNTVRFFISRRSLNENAEIQTNGVAASCDADVRYHAVWHAERPHLPQKKPTKYILSPIPVTAMPTYRRRMGTRQPELYERLVYGNIPFHDDPCNGVV